MRAADAPRVFSRERDLVPLVDLIGRLRAGPPGSSYLHPGGLQWLMRKTPDPEFAIHVWDDGDTMTGVVVIDGDYAMAHADPARNDVLDLIAWSESDARRGGRSAVEISVWDDDTPLRAAVAARGYAPAGHFGPLLVWRMNGEPPAPSLPPGYRFVDFTADMDDAYVEMHRDAWSVIRPSPYRRERHDRVTAMPQFERGMVPIVAAPDGTLAAYCIGWYDPVSRWTEIEPLGTRPAHAGRGLAHAVVREVIRRSWRRGAEAVMVWATDPASTVHVNEPARRLYESSAMRAERVLREYRKAL